MKLICTLKKPPIVVCLFAMLLMNLAKGQVCSNPATTIYGMMTDGGIYPINTTTGAVGARINPAFTGNPAASANALGYNPNTKYFYFFKRNADQSPQEFVVYNSVANTHTILASCPTTANIKTGAVNSTGTGYYCMDVTGKLYFYRFTSNMWRLITSTYFNQWGTNVTATLVAHTSGDIVFDGWGNLWFLCSDATTYGLYRFDPPPTVTVASLVAHQKIAPTTPTPNGVTVAGIAFNPTGQIFLSQYGGDRLYRLENNLTTTLIGTTSVSGVGTDLTSCNLPMFALATNWKDFTVEARGDLSVLSWTVLNETNIKGYYIEFSIDAENWKTIAFVESKGIEEIQNSYSFSAPTTSGRNYYRIRQVNFDGKYSYSEVKFIDIKINNQVSIGPNPTKGMIQVKNSMSMSARIYIFDITGQLMRKAVLNKGMNNINISHFPSGTYLVRVQAENGQVFHEKMIKE